VLPLGAPANSNESGLFPCHFVASSSRSTVRSLLVPKVPAGVVKSSVNVSELPLANPVFAPPAQLLPENAQTSTSWKAGKLPVLTWVKTEPPFTVSPVTSGSTPNPIAVRRPLTKLESFVTPTWSFNSDEVNVRTVIVAFASTNELPPVEACQLTLKLVGAPEPAPPLVPSR
jgi:hypothetical protein